MASPAVLQFGGYNALTDAFTAFSGSPTGAVIDLNDGVNLTIEDTGGGLGQGLDLGTPAPTVYDAGNPRTVGRAVQRIAWEKNREIRVKLLWGPQGTYATFIAIVHNLAGAFAAITPTTPAALKIQLSGSSTPVYADVLAAYFPGGGLPYDEVLFTQGLGEVEVAFVCKPFLRGARAWLHNLAWNPGFEAPFGGSLALSIDNSALGAVFNDSLANLNAYAVQAGGALAQDKAYYPDAVLADTPLRYYRFDEASGTTAFDATSNAQNGTLNGGITLAASGGLTGDTDTAYTFNGTTGYVSVPTSGIPTGASACSIECWFHIGAAYPAGTVVLMGHGSWFTAHQLLYLQLSATGTLSAANGSITTTATAALSKNAWHHAVAVWDGSKLFCYCDGTATDAGTADASMNVTIGAAAVGANAAHSGNFYGDSLDECAWYAAALSPARVTAHYNAGHNSPSSASNTAVLASGNRVSFGSPAWGALQRWRLRFRFFSGATATFYLHRTDANNYLAYVLTATAFTLNQVVGGATHQVATQAIQLVNGVEYWLQATQFPAPASDPPYVTATLSYDALGAVGATVANSTCQGATFDAVTALVGAPQVATSGGALGLGGNYAAVHVVWAFGPGGWAPSLGGGTGPCSGAWDGACAEVGQSGNAATGTQTYGGGPVTSFGAARLDLAPAGTVDAYWALLNGMNAPLWGGLCPVKTAGDVLGVSAWVKTNGLGVAATVKLEVWEYGAGGGFLRSGVVQTLTGNQGAWTQLSGTYTTGASCALADVHLRVADTNAGASANGTAWFDNVQAWDQTTTGQAAMPYCETQFPAAPAQIVLSGLVGDVPAPAWVGLATYQAGLAAGSTLTYAVGRRAVASAGARLVAPAVGYYGATFTPTGTPALDYTQYGGYYVSASMSNGGWSPRAVSPAAADALGTYHVVARFWTADAAPTSVQARVKVEEAQHTWFTDTNGVGTLGTWWGAYVNPVAAGSTWTLCDVGPVTLPPFGQGLLGDPAQLYLVPRAEWVGSSGSSYAARAGWAALVPEDGGVLSGTIINPASNPAGSVAGYYVWAYFDQVGAAANGSWANPSAAYSLEAQPLPAPAHAGGGPGVATGAGPLNVNAAADAALTLDPTTLVGTTAVNQLVAYVADGTGAPQSLWTQFAYSPLYVYPK